MPIFGVPNQGTQKTCVPTAVAISTSHSLLQQQGIVIQPQRLADRFEDRADCWDTGITVVQFCERWNQQHQFTWIKNDAGTELYQIQLEASEEIWQIEEAY